MKKKYLILIVITLLFMVACNKSVEPAGPVDEPIVNEAPEIDKTISEEEQEQVLKEYYDLLKVDSEDIIEFIDANINKLDSYNADKIIISLEEQLSVKNENLKETINTLEKYSNYTSEELRSYLNILSVESNASFTDGEDIKIELEEILSRASIAEKHLKEFPNGDTYLKVYDYFNAYVSASILGAGNQFIYGNDGNSTIKDEVLKQYNNLIEDKKDSYTSNILSRYLEELKLDNMDLNGPNVLKFYDDLEGIIKSTLRK